MKVINLNPVEVAQRKSNVHVCVLGFFDGVHLGHQALISNGKQIALKKGVPLRVMTFAPHPSVIVRPDKAITSYLTPLDEKARCMEQLGVDELCMVSFTKETAAMAPAQFVQIYLTNQQCVHAVVGFDFAYGKRGSGKATTLYQHGLGEFDVTIVEELLHKKRKIGSTEIRKKLEQGDVQSIPAMLGRPFTTKVILPNFQDKRVEGLIEIEYHIPQVGVYEVVLAKGKTMVDAICYVSGVQKDGMQTIEFLFKRNVHFKKGTYEIEWLNRCEEAEAEEVVWNHEHVYAF